MAIHRVRRSILAVGIAAVTCLAPLSSTFAQDEPPTAETTVPTTEPEHTDEVGLYAGLANWDFRRSFRDYVGLDGEDLTSVKRQAQTNNLIWPLMSGQSFDPENPGVIKFGGEVAWYKYDGQLDVTMSNPVVDLMKKELRITAHTAGTMAGGGELNVTDEPLLKMNDLRWEMREGYLLIYSHAPVITELSHRLLGFYNGEAGSPFLATIRLDQPGSTLPDPVLSDFFPDRYKPAVSKPDVEANADKELVTVPDDTLAQCIRTELDLDSSTALTKKHMQELASLQCIGVNTPEEKKVRSLAGLEHATNLARLRITHQALTSLKLGDDSSLTLSPELVDLDVSNNKLTSLAGVEKLAKLNNLTANDNKISDISAAAHLIRASFIDLTNNEVSDLSALNYDAFEEKFTDYEGINTLRFEGNKVADLSPIGTQYYLRELNAKNNQLTSADPIARLRVLEKVDLSNNFITDPSKLARWAENSNRGPKVYLAMNKFTDWSALDALGDKLVDRPDAGKESEAVNPKNPGDEETPQPQPGDEETEKPSVPAELMPAFADTKAIEEALARAPRMVPTVTVPEGESVNLTFTDLAPKAEAGIYTYSTAKLVDIAKANDKGELTYTLSTQGISAGEHFVVATSRSAQAQNSIIKLVVTPKKAATGDGRTPPTSTESGAPVTQVSGTPVTQVSGTPVTQVSGTPVKHAKGSGRTTTRTLAFTGTSAGILMLSSMALLGIGVLLRRRKA